MSSDPPQSAGPTVRELLGELGQDLVAGAEEAEVLVHNRRLTPGVWKVRLADGTSAVLKYLRADREPGDSDWDRHWTADDQGPHRWNYWAREALAYQSGVTDIYDPAGISAPRCLASRVGDRDAVLLLEWVPGQPGESWPVADYGGVAEALGRAQARFALGGRQPAPPWLSTGFLREYSSEKPVDWGLLDDAEAWEHPLARRRFPPGLRDGLTFLHAHRERLYRIGEGLPRTVFHLDVWPKNLIRRGDGTNALIDWAFVGDGALGEDIGNLIPDASFDHFVRAQALPELERTIFDAYLTGARSAGWREDPRLLQLGMWASAVKYDWLGPLTLAQLGEDRQISYGGAGEVDADFKFSERGQGLLFITEWAAQAIALADQLGL